jgi:nitroreductase
MNRIPPSEFTPWDLLTTTRSVRKRLDLRRPVARELVRGCLEVALQAPTGSNLQGWQFVVIDEPVTKHMIAAYYCRSHALYRQRRGVSFDDSAPRAERDHRLDASVDYLSEHLHEVPVLIMPLQRGRLAERPTAHEAAGFYGSILPAVWSYMLAARLHGLGTTFTTMHLRFEAEVAKELGIPYEEFTQVGLVPTAYFTGDTFSPAQRLPVESITHWNEW